ncbi:MAG TPA: hypothetical protein VM577_18810 [Anaerovoracaceae bacterium]|nr:hypothetical protein [Anaerovoracaceae bacterium]
MKYIHPKDVKRWGVDIGNVLVENFNIKITDPSQVTWENVKGNGRLVPGAIEGLKLLIDKVGAENVWIVSKVSPIQQMVSELVLKELQVCERTGMRPEQIRFCLERKDKAPIIKELQLEGHIDDRGEVIDSLQNFLPCPIWFAPSQKDMLEWDDYISQKVLMVFGWAGIIAMVE